MPPAADSMHLHITSAQEFEHKAGTVWKEGKSALSDLIERATEYQVLLYCENQAEFGRVGEILRQSAGGIPKHLSLILGYVHQGFILQDLKTIIVSHHELFGQVSIRRRIRTLRSVSPIDTMMDLQKGDYVVHVSYGIGRFVGVEMMEKGGQTGEYITIEYADKVRIYVPVSNIHLVHKFVGAMPRPSHDQPNRHQKMGKTETGRRCRGAGTGRGITGYPGPAAKAGRLCVRLRYPVAKGIRGVFPYQETPDQTTAAGQIKDRHGRSDPDGSTALRRCGLRQDRTCDAGGL